MTITRQYTGFIWKRHFFNFLYTGTHFSSHKSNHFFHSQNKKSEYNFIQKLCLDPPLIYVNHNNFIKTQNLSERYKLLRYKFWTHKMEVGYPLVKRQHFYATIIFAHKKIKPLLHALRLQWKCSQVSKYRIAAKDSTSPFSRALEHHIKGQRKDCHFDQNSPLL